MNQYSIDITETVVCPIGVPVCDTGLHIVPDGVWENDNTFLASL